MFNELNTVENFIRDTLCGQQPSPKHGRFGEAAGAYIPLGRNPKGVGWHYVPAIDLPRRINDVFIEKYLRESLIRLNPSIAEKPERADEVIYKLRAIILSVRSDGLIRANENFTNWLRGERSMPFGAGNEHIAVRLLDYEDLDQNQYIATTQYTFRAGAAERRPDLMLFINGIPLVLIEAKTPVRHAVSWFDGAVQVHDDYERFVPELFTPNIFSVATEGKDLRYGAIHAPIDKWGPWRPIDSLISSDDGAGKGADDGTGARVTQGLLAVQKAYASLLRPTVLLDILAHFTLFATDKKKRRLKLIARYQQYEGANQIVQRVLSGTPRKGLIWHFQGSGKSLLMVFAAQKLRLQPALKNPAVLIVVDRVDLDSQISATFHASDIPNLIKADSRKELSTLLRQDTRKIIITTIFKFGDVGAQHAAPQHRAPQHAAPLQLNDRENIIVMVDEAHRTQEGDLGMKMRAALPHAFFFGLTGTPINRRDRNTFYAFGAEEDERGYMNRYGFEESIRDGATLPLHFEPRLVELHIDKDSIDRAYAELTGGLNDLDREQLSKAAAKMKVLVKVPDRIEKICADIAHHFLKKVRPNGFKAMVVTYDRESCLLYKEHHLRFQSGSGR